MDFVAGFHMADRHYGRAEKTGGVEALFTLVITDVLCGECRPIKNLFGIGKIKTVLL